jgi:hypothetical protein
MKKLLLLPLSAALLFSAGMPAAHATLTPALGGQVVNDTDLNITWLANANLAATNTFGVSGIDPSGYMHSYTATLWIDAMNAANYLGYNDWRLPTTLQPDATCGGQSGGVSSGYGCTGSEMGHLFYTELGGAAGSSIQDTNNGNLALFQNVQSRFYWSGTAYAPAPYDAWVFNMGEYTYEGLQTAYADDLNSFAWAVRTGQVATVPEPETWAMLLVGVGLVGFRLRGARVDELHKLLKG